MTNLLIAQVLPFQSGQVGGVNAFVNGLSEHLRYRKHKVTVIRALPTENLKARTGQLSFLRRVSRELARMAPDVIHAHSHWYALEAALRSLRPQTRCLFTFHTEWNVRSRRLSRFLKSRASKCAGISFVSKYLQETFAHHLPLSVPTVISYPGVSAQTVSVLARDSIRRKFAPHAGPIILWVGNLSWPEKVAGLKILIHAASDFLPEATVLVVGDGDFRSLLLNEFAGQIHRGTVAFVGGVESVWPYYAAADVYAHISLKETLGIAVLEAMSMGKACVVAKTGGLVEVVDSGRTGILVNADSASIGEAVEAILRDPTLRDRLGRAAQIEVKERFTWDGAWKALSPLYGAP